MISSPRRIAQWWFAEKTGFITRENRLSTPFSAMTVQSYVTVVSGPRASPAARTGVDEEDDLDRPFRGRPVEPGDFTVAFVRSLPWLVIGLVLGAIFVFTAFASNEKDDPAAEDLLGKCVVAEIRVATVVPCTQENDGRVVTVATQASDCPSTTDAAAVVDDRWLCVRPLPDVRPGSSGP